MMRLPHKVNMLLTVASLGGMPMGKVALGKPRQPRHDYKRASNTNTVVALSSREKKRRRAEEQWHAAYLEREAKRAAKGGGGGS